MMNRKLKIRLVTLGILGAGVLLIGWVWWSHALAAADHDAQASRTFVINQGQNVRSIANQLKQEGLIRDPIAFFLMIRLSGMDEQIQAGNFRLSPSMDVKTIADELKHGVLDIWVTTLEGWRSEEIAAELEDTLGIPAQEFLQVSREGYMFPDTYLIPREASAAEVAELFEENFFARIDSDYQAQARAQGLTMDEAVTLASIVEREVNTDADRPLVAGILLKRLDNDWLLDADATVQYALGFQPDENTWWKEQLTSADLEIDLPYNTRRSAGLPPGPIGNPGLASLEAVVNPQESEYWFYLTGTDGVNRYAKTLAEHEANIEKYLQ